MWGTLYNLLDVLANNTVRSILTAMGLGLTTFYISSEFLQRMIAYAQSHMNHFEYVGLIGLLGIDDGLSIIFSAVLTRISLNANKVFLVKTGD